MFGFLWGIAQNGFHWYEFAERFLSPDVIDYVSLVVGPFFMFLPPIVCVALAQWLKFRQCKVKFDNYQWMAANFKGTFIACMIVFIIGLVVGEFQRLSWISFTVIILRSRKPI